MPLEVSVRTQINMALGDLSGMAHVKQFSHMVLPLLWSEIVSSLFIPLCFDLQSQETRKRVARSVQSERAAATASL